MKEELLKIINNYGIMPQLKYFQSEIFELNEAIIQFEDDKTNPISMIVDVCSKIIAPIQGTTPPDRTAHIKEEIADVTVMLKQFQYYYEIEDKEIAEIMKYKVERQLERINRGE